MKGANYIDTCQTAMNTKLYKWHLSKMEIVPAIKLAYDKNTSFTLLELLSLFRLSYLHCP